MFQLYTDDARRVLTVAHRHASRLRRTAVGVEHLLVGLIEYGRGATEEAFFSVDISPGEAWTRLGELAETDPSVEFGEQPVTLPYTKGASRVFGISLEEKRRLQHNYLGCEHVLLALLRLLDDPWAEPELAAELLDRLGVDPRTVREALVCRIPTDPDRIQPSYASGNSRFGLLTQMDWWTTI